MYKINRPTRWEIAPETVPLTMHKVIERVGDCDLIIAERVHRDWSSLVAAAPDLLKAATEIVDLWHNAGWPEAQIFQRLEQAISKAKERVDDEV